MDRQKPSDLTITDMFCGAGGSSIGARTAGLRLVLGLNHWPRAIEMHSQNFPGAGHDCRNVSETDPRRYPSTNILWASPECVTWSQARGRRRNYTAQPALSEEFEPLPTEAEERSRATMWDVVRYSEFHGYDAVVVENVVDLWPWALRDVWLSAMHALGCEHRVLWLNSMFFSGVPQSRDRLYIVFWRRGNRRPELEHRPRSYCRGCRADVEGVQSWKRPQRPWGCYRQQYLYRCPTCAGEVAPYVWPAASAIDWAIPGERIGARKKPLAPATIARIQAGIERYWTRPVAFDLLWCEKYRAVMEEPLATQTGRQSQALYLPEPFLLQLRGTSHGHVASSARSMTAPLGTISGGAGRGGVHHGFVTPVPLYMKGYGSVAKAGSMAHPVADPLGAITGKDHHYVLMPPLVVPVNGGGHGDGGHKVRSAGEPLLTQTGDLARAVVTPLVTSYYGRENATRPASEPMGTLTGDPRHALLKPPAAFVSSYYRNGGNRPAASPWAC